MTATAHQLGSNFLFSVALSLKLSTIQGGKANNYELCWHNVIEKKITENSV